MTVAPWKIQNFRNATTGARPGANGLRSLLDGEIFLNTKDGILCYLDASGVLQTAYFLNAAGMASWLATLPTTVPSSAGVWWNNAGVPTLSTAS